MKILILLSAFLIAVSAQALSVLQESQNFLVWLEKNKSQFSKCTVEKGPSTALLCDQTSVDISALEKMFKLSEAELFTEIEKNKVRLQYICDEGAPSDSPKSRCAANSLKQKFKKMSQLHGLYIPEESIILLKRNSTKAVIIHEYIHHLQTMNSEKIDGRVYKAERNQLQQKINQELDRLMLEIAELENKKDKQALMLKASEFIQINDVLLKLGKWQDYIDERSIFSLFLKYQAKFGLSAEDLALVKKNLKFICNSAALKDFTMPECSL